MFEMENVLKLFQGKMYGELFTYAIKRKTNYKGEVYYTFGKVYEVNGKKFYDCQGCNTFNSAKYAIVSAIEFSGQLNQMFHLNEWINKASEL